MGAIKAGVTVVTFSEKDSIEALGAALKDSHCKGLIFSPSTEISEGEDQLTRKSHVQKLMPELERLYPGDALNLK